MRQLDTSRQFERDLKKALKQRKDIRKLQMVISLLQMDEPLSSRNRPHKLTGNWRGYHECHIEPDWLLIYKPVGKNILQLARLGSHAELFKK